MKEVKVFARAGQGAITTVSILGEALFREGKYAYAFPHFGAARMGAPMNAFLRFDSRPVRLRSQVNSPDYIIVVDPTLLESERCFLNVKSGGIAIVAIRDEKKLSSPKGISVFTLPAEKIAMEIIGHPFSNTVLLGAFSKATKELKLDSIFKAVEERFIGKPEIAKKNIEAVKRGYEEVKLA
ncbi:MAG: 2-oxoacid:acceptor oxidoreductase family protein [Candidatus Omnitrophica bacterium]|nr:2-oxoacid:acceptor oxidoreductase family protein [Candidatus Omnitrophota bacterium]MCM8826371.1 2-oxoacid:acceptor oxidoreductase family protein [Candidatus Omnitrophota bacterium]